MPVNNKDLPQWWHDSHSDVRIMTICEGYVMARRPRCSPFVKSIADFKITFQKGKRP